MGEVQNRSKIIIAKTARRLFASYLRLFSLQAKRLNDELFSDINTLSLQEWEQFGNKIKAYCDAREYMPDYTSNWLQHKYRLYLSIKWLEDIIPGNAIHHGMDLGWDTPATDLWRENFPSVSWNTSQGDLRHRWNMHDESVDLIVCTEVLEHLSDIPDGINDSFQMTGLRAVLSECYRVLHQQGWLFITTPNAISMVQIERLLWGNLPWFFPEHIREYEPRELLDEISKSGFSIHRWRTVHCLTADEEKDYTWIYQLLLVSGYPVAHRGDDIFIIARKE